MTTRTEVIKYLSECHPSTMKDILSDVTDYKFDQLGVELPDWLKQHSSNHVQFYKDMIVMLHDLGMPLPKFNSEVDCSDEDDEDEDDEDDYDGDGYDLRHYRGRFFYDGPGIVVPAEALSDVYAATRVPLQMDNMGLDYILYPAR